MTGTRSSNCTVAATLSTGHVSVSRPIQSVANRFAGFDHVRGWLQAAEKHPDKVLVISYEELQVNLLGMTKLIAEFVGKPQSEETIRDIVEHCSFSQMKDNPSVNRQETGVTDLFDRRFMRKGVIGDWRTKFTKEQSEQIDALFAEKLGDLGLRMAYSTAEAESMMDSSKSGRIVMLPWMKKNSMYAIGKRANAKKDDAGIQPQLSLSNKYELENDENENSPFSTISHSI